MIGMRMTPRHCSQNEDYAYQQQEWKNREHACCSSLMLEPQCYEQIKGEHAPACDYDHWRFLQAFDICHGPLE